MLSDDEGGGRWGSRARQAPWKTQTRLKKSSFPCHPYSVAQCAKPRPSFQNETKHVPKRTPICRTSNRAGGGSTLPKSHIPGGREADAYRHNDCRSRGGNHGVLPIYYTKAKPGTCAGSRVAIRIKTWASNPGNHLSKPGQIIKTWQF